MRKRDEELSKGWGQFVTPLSVDTIGGKQKLNCANASGNHEISIGFMLGKNKPAFSSIFNHETSSRKKPYLKWMNY